MLMSKGKETNLSKVACSSFNTSLIHFFDLKNYTKADCAFHYWAEQNSRVLSQLAWIVFAVTMTQVTVERLFSGVKFILSVVCAILWQKTLCKQLCCNALMCERINSVFVISIHQLSSFPFIKRVSP